MSLPYDPTHPVFEVEAVLVPVEGTFLVRDGEVLPAEADLCCTTSTDWKWDVWTDPIEEEDE